MEKTENKDTENLKIGTRYCKTCKCIIICNVKNLFTYFNSGRQSCYAYIAGFIQL